MCQKTLQYGWIISLYSLTVDLKDENQQHAQPT